MNESGRGEGIRTPGPMLPKHVRYQAALHPGAFFLQDLSYRRRNIYYTILPRLSTVFFAFLKIPCHFSTILPAASGNSLIKGVVRPF